MALIFGKLYSKSQLYDELHGRRHIANLVSTLADGYENALEKVENRVVRNQDKDKLCKLLMFEIQN